MKLVNVINPVKQTVNVTSFSQHSDFFSKLLEHKLSFKVVWKTFDLQQTML